MKLQSAVRTASSRFLWKPTSTYCSAHWIRGQKPESTVIAGLGTRSSWPLGRPANELHLTIMASLPIIGNRCRRRHLHRTAGAVRTQ